MRAYPLLTLGLSVARNHSMSRRVMNESLHLADPEAVRIAGQLSATDEGQKTYIFQPWVLHVYCQLWDEPGTEPTYAVYAIRAWYTLWL